MAIKNKKMENQGFNGKNEEPFIPEGLEYRDEHWQKALDGIIRHEKRSDRRRRGWIFSIVGLVLLVGSYAIGSFIATPDETAISNKQSDSTISAIPESQKPAQITPPVEESDELNKTISVEGDSKNPSKSPLVKPSPEYKPDKDQANQKAFTEVINEIIQPAMPVSSAKPNEKMMASTLPPEEEFIIPGGSLQQHAAEMTPELSIQSINSDSANWDRNFSIPYISKLALSPLQQELQRSYMLRADRNWTEPTWKLWAYGGSSLVTDFSSPLRDIRIDPMAGLRLEYNFNKRIFVDGGLEYFAISNVRRPYSQTSIAYDLNYQRTITTVETHQLHYISIPLHMGYRVARRHQFTLGFGLSYMITGINEIFQYRETPTSNTLINRYDDSGFVEGFKDFPIHSEIGYSYKLGRNKSIRFAYQFGLTDITKNDYFNSPSFDRNSRFLIDLSFKLKSK